MINDKWVQTEHVSQLDSILESVQESIEFLSMLMRECRMENWFENERLADRLESEISSLKHAAKQLVYEIEVRDQEKPTDE